MDINNSFLIKCQHYFENFNVKSYIAKFVKQLWFQYTIKIKYFKPIKVVFLGGEDPDRRAWPFWPLWGKDWTLILCDFFSFFHYLVILFSHPNCNKSNFHCQKVKVINDTMNVNCHGMPIHNYNVQSMTLVSIAINIKL